VSETRTWNRFYPELIRAGSLAGALDAELANIRSALRTSGTLAGVNAPSFASVASGKRSAQVLLGLEERSFILSIWEDEVEMADGDAPELSDVAAAIRLVLESGPRKVSDLVAEIPFLELEEFALSFERGTYVEDKWREFLAERWHERSGEKLFHWDDLAELIRLAAERPDLRRFLPYTSLHRFSVTRSPIPDRSIPVIWPRGDGRFTLMSDRDNEVFASGDASVVLDALVAFVRRLE
jgi:hypothetical protein